MSVTSVEKMWSRDGGSATSDGRKYTVSYREGWQVICAPTDTFETVLFAPGLPRHGDTLSGTNWIFCRDVNPQRVSPIMWLVDVEYSGDLGAASGGASINNSPENEPPLIEWTDVETEEPTDEDDNGLPITNVNGELTQGITARLADSVLNVDRNYLLFNNYLTREYRRSVNSDTFMGWPPGTAKMMRFSAKAKIVDGQVKYWRVSASIHFREAYNTIPARAWWKRYRNEGLYERSGATVTFTGGGGTGAYAHAVTDKFGSVEAVVIVSGGSGYASAPTVTISEEPAGRGGGARATATVTDGVVTAVTITSPGSNYRNKLIRAVDGNKEPVTSPVLLDQTGVRLKKTSEAIWLERPVKVTPLPYGLLGLV